MALLLDEGAMIGSALSKLAKSSAVDAMVLRGAIVAVNFAVMIGLAAVMGLRAFGALVVIWGLAMVASTALSVGAPLLLLRRLTDGGGLSPKTLVTQVMVLPLVIAVPAFFVLDALVPGLPWIAILSAGLVINLATCLASIMRALGSMHASMALRDAAPHVALGLAGVSMLGSQAPMMVMQTVIWLGVCSALAAMWCVRHPRWGELIKPDGVNERIAWSLWGTSVLGMGLAQIDIVVGGSFLSAEQIGLYAVLRRVANLVALPVSVATWVSAGPVSAAHGAGDKNGLREASSKGSLIALIPGFFLFCLALAALPILDFVIGQATGAQGRWLFVILLMGALIQVVFASSFTVATLCGHAHFAAGTRLISITSYLTALWLLGPVVIGPIANGGLYVGATALGSIILWALIQQRLHVDTSACVLLSRQEGRWKLS